MASGDNVTSRRAGALSASRAQSAVLNTVDKWRQREEYPFFPQIDYPGPARAQLADGRVVRVFCSADYLGMAHHPEVMEAAVDAVHRFGPHLYGVQAVGGYLSPHRELEAALAGFFGKPDAVVFPTGMLANMGLLVGVFGPRDAIFVDEFAHGSIPMGGKLSGATARVYRHNDTGHLLELLERHSGGSNRVIVTDSLFSADGDISDIAELVSIAREHDAVLVVDEAHAMGVIGPGGRGVAAAAGVLDDVDVVTGTLSKAFASVGGFVAASRQVTELIRHTASAYLLSAGPAPSSAAAALAALRVTSGPEGDSRRRQLASNAAKLRERLRDGGLDIGAATAHIVPVVLGSVDRAAATASQLAREGLLTGVLVPPAVPFGGARLRLGVLCDHSPDDIDHAADLITATVARPRGDTDSTDPTGSSKRRPVSTAGTTKASAAHGEQSLAGRHAIITGGSSGIGLATAAVLAGRGAVVSLLARGPERLGKAAESLRSQGFEVHTHATDVRDRAAVDSSMQQAVAEAGPCDILVTSAGIARPGRFLELSDEVFQDTIDTNYYGTLWAVRAVAAEMKRRGSGTVITISSAAGLVGLYGYTAYAPTKFAVRGLAESLRAELRPHGVQVSCVCPPDVETPQLIEENRCKPAETFVVTEDIAPLSPQTLAEKLVHEALDRHQFLVCPGMDDSLLSWTAGPGMTGLRMYMDYLVDSVQHNQTDTPRQ